MTDSTAESAKKKTEKPQTNTPPTASAKPKTKTTPAVKTGTSTPKPGGSKPTNLSGLATDIAALGISDDSAPVSRDDGPVPAMSMKRIELIEKIQKEEAEGKKGVSLVVVGEQFAVCSRVQAVQLKDSHGSGHVDAGKSTLMGRLLYDLGRLSEKEKTANERGSQRVGKGSFAYAWGLDALGDERDR
jgi:elongation factor 1 alpha-like protein